MVFSIAAKIAVAILTAPPKKVIVPKAPIYTKSDWQQVAAMLKGRD